MLRSLSSIHYKAVCVLRYVEKTETLGKDPLTQFAANFAGVLSPAYDKRHVLCESDAETEQIAVANDTQSVAPKAATVQSR